MKMLDLLTGGLAQAAADAFKSRQERKNTEKTLEAAIAQKKLDNTAQVELNEKQWELLSKWSEQSTWKDEYVTVSIVSILNLIVVGGVLAAFGYPQMLEGVSLAMRTLADIGVDVGLIILLTVSAALGVYGINKLRGV